ncbi:MAG: BMP family ABC transporter substrate-binding protein [Spirochaetota bacterium]
MSTPFSGHQTAAHRAKKASVITAVVLAVLVTAVSCAKPQQEESSEVTASQEERQPYSVAVFVPGIIAGSATYEKLVSGAQEAADEYEHVTAQIIEGGSNQGEWEEKISSLASSGDHDVIVTSNPAMPEICAAVAEKFPDQHFIVLDGHLEGNDQIYTLRYDQYQQAYLAGHMAGLVTTSDMPGANDEFIIGLVAGQEYPDMNEQILPGYREGARLVHDEVTVDFRVVGNWYDAAKGAELARAMISDGADVILTIAGGANQGVLTAAEEQGVYVHWYDSNGYGEGPGTVIGSTAILQDTASYETIVKAVEGELQYGSAEVVGVQEGYITFIEADEHYEQTVPESIRNLQQEFVTEFTTQ